MEPKISIIVPIYNVEQYLNQCVDSLLNQSHKNLEIILVDDESPDNCAQICDDYKLKDDRIVVIHQKNKGLSGARNSGLEIATGDYVAFVDSDDWVGLDTYNTLLNLALENDLDIIECGISETSLVENPTDDGSTTIKIENVSQALKRIINNTQFSACTKLFKRLLIGDSRFKLNKTSEDIYFAVENIPKIKKMGYYDVPFYSYRPNPTSITKSPYSLKRLDDSITAGLYLEKNLKSLADNDTELKEVIKQHMLFKVDMHYKRLNYNAQLDPDYKHRNYLKELLDHYYYKSNQHDFYLKLASRLSTKSFNKLIRLNELKHKLLKTNQI
ncbi:glycosyltransferase [Winogradskyella sp.]|uniref:glycosyltransferase n=1 Tax=Winogradskyella sp. TaxID=1883156 RepID=UPI0025DADA77|nr:glycosyltransferase [Winogradskyella sp.]